MDISFPA